MTMVSIFIVLLVHVMCSNCVEIVSAFSRIPQHNIKGRQHNPLASGWSKTITVQSNQSPRRRRVNSFSLELLSTDNDVCTKSGGSDDDDANEVSTYYTHLLSQFQGDFDNYNQVVQDRLHELTPGEGGGHEHIHCTLLPCPQYNNDESSSSQWILAAFYFNGNPRQIFRFRLYQIIKPSFDEDVHVRMKLNTLLPHLEKELRECSDQPCTWWNVVWDVWCKENNQDNISVNEEGWNQLQTKGIPTLVSPLEGCDVLWETNWDKSKHPYLYVNEYYNDNPTTKSLPDDISDSASTRQVLLPTGQSYHATMEAGSKGAIVDSISMIPGKRILIKDELSLWKDEFWINDRGYDPDAKDSDTTTEKQETDSNKTGNETSMPFVYGNRRGVPYKLQRISNFRVDTSLGIERVSAKSDLEWTLGEDYRTSDLFEKKMQHIENAQKV